MRYVAGKPLFVETPLWDDQRESLRADVHVDAEKCIDTGLVTASGQRIYRVNDPVGFGRDKER